MIQVSDLHEKAMDFAELAFIARKNGDSAEFQQYSEQAYQLEKTAALLLIDTKTFEISRSILFRSAASLAIQCGKLHEAESLIDEAFKWSPPVEIAIQLVDLIKVIQERVYPNASRSFSFTYSPKDGKRTGDELRSGAM